MQRRKPFSGLLRVARLAQLSVAGGLAMGVGTALADELDPINFLVGMSRIYDSNLFRISDSADPQTVLGGPGKSDTVTITQVGVKIDKPYSLQRFQFNFVQSDYRYDNYKRLNFSGTDYMANWKWSLTPHLTGNLSRSRTEGLINYADAVGFSGKNVRVNEVTRFDADFELTSTWHLLGAIYQENQKNSQFFGADGAYEFRRTEAGVKYLFGSGSYVNVLARTGDGDYTDRTVDPLNQVDSGFSQDDLEFNANWVLSAHSGLRLRLTDLERKHDNFSSRNYAGTAGRLEYIWMPTEKLGLSAYATRDLYSFQSSTTSYYVLRTLGVAPVWTISEKLTLTGRLENGRRDYAGSIIPVSESREDKIDTNSLILAWKPLKTVTVTSTLRREKRESNVPGADYRDRSLGVAAQLLF